MKAPLIDPSERVDFPWPALAVVALLLSVVGVSWFGVKYAVAAALPTAAEVAAAEAERERRRDAETEECFLACPDHCAVHYDPIGDEKGHVSCVCVCPGPH